jgi:hypothetical protein
MNYCIIQGEFAGQTIKPEFKVKLKAVGLM